MMTVVMQTVMKILSGIVFMIGFYAVITFIEAVSLRNSFTGIKKPDDVICSLEPAAKSQHCVELKNLTDKMQIINDKLTFPEVVYCNMFKVFSFSELERTCANFRVAETLYVKIIVLKDVITIRYKNN